jgi:amino acid transporter
LWVLVFAVLVLVLGYLGIQISTRAGTVLGIFEIGVFGALADWLIVKAGDGNTLSVFTLQHANAEGFLRLPGVFAGSVFTILAFIGFEAAAPLAEESRDPRRTIPRAVIGSAVAIGLFYVVTTYAATVFFGPGRMAAGFHDLGGGNPWEALGRDLWGLGWVLVFLAIVNSGFANANAAANASTRTWYAMGRIRVLPSALARTHPRWKSPTAGVVIQFVLGIAVPLWLGFQFDPFTALGLIATIVVIMAIAIYVAVNVACVAYYWRFRRDEANLLLHGVVPVAGIVAFVPAFLAGAGIKVFSFITPLSYPLSLAGPITGAWMAVGLMYLLVLYAIRPERVRDVAKVFLQESSAPQATGVS